MVTKSAATFVALALACLAKSAEGRAACVAAAAPAALVHLLRQPEVRGSVAAPQWVAYALANIARDAGPGRAACRAAGAAPALRSLTAQSSRVDEALQLL